MAEEEAIEKIRQLPWEVQEHLFLFIDFLHKTYGCENNDEADFHEEYELTEEGKAFLRKRLEQAKAHPEKHRPWREVIEEMHKKHGLPPL